MLTNPDSSALPSIQDVKLHARLVDNSPRQTIERIDLSDNCALADTAETRIAGTRSQIIHLGRNQGCSRASSRSSSTCLSASMTTSDNHDIIRSTVDC